MFWGAGPHSCNSTIDLLPTTSFQLEVKTLFSQGFCPGIHISSENSFSWLILQYVYHCQNLTVSLSFFYDNGCKVVLNYHRCIFWMIMKGKDSISVHVGQLRNWKGILGQPGQSDTQGFEKQKNNIFVNTWHKKPPSLFHHKNRNLNYMFLLLYYKLKFVQPQSTLFFSISFFVTWHGTT